MSNTQHCFELNNGMTSFEQATLEQHVSYKAHSDKDVIRLLSCEKLISEVKLMVAKWNKNRVELGLPPFK